MLVLRSASRCGPAYLLLKVNVIRSDFAVAEPSQFSPTEKLARLVSFISSLRINALRRNFQNGRVRLSPGATWDAGRGTAII
jgi:hypothetical protein